MTLYEILKLFEAKSTNRFYIHSKNGTKSKNLFGNKIDFYRIKQAIEYHEDAEDIFIASYADKNVTNIDIINDIITIEE